IHVVQGVVEDLAGAGEEVPPESPTAANPVFPQPRLRLVKSQRRRLAHRRAVMLRGQALVVQPVADLVQDTKETVAEVVQIVAGGQATVAGTDQRAEGMNAGVEAAAGEVAAQR